MAIISIVLCLFIERFSSSLYKFRQFGWFNHYIEFILRLFINIHLKNGKSAVLLIVLPPALLIGFIDLQLYYTFQPLSFAFSSFILIYCFGPQTFYDRCKAFCQVKLESEKDCACWYAEKILDRPLLEKEKNQLPYIITKALFVITNDRILAPIFWFVILGPMGAILYRCSNRLYHTCSSQADKHIRYERIKYSASFFFALINWLPSRLSMFGFAAMGNFFGMIKQCAKNRTTFFNIDQHNSETLLICSGSGAVNLSDTPENVGSKAIPTTLAMLRRSTQLWLGAIALLTIIGWIS